MPPARVPKGGTRGTVYREIARLRITDARTLLDHARYSGAIYLAGYAIECQLKFAFCENKNATYLKADLEIHDWDVLVDKAGLRAGINAQVKMAALYAALVDLWGPQLRYSSAKISAGEAKRLYNEMEALYQFIQELVP